MVSDEELNEIETDFNPRPAKGAPPGPFYHYTDSAGFHGILKDGEIRATYYGFLNDREELHIGEALIQRVAQELLDGAPGGTLEQRFFRIFLKNWEGMRLSKRILVCVASFCEAGDQLSQWRAYAASGGGYSIGFSCLPVPDETAAPPDASLAVGLYRCIYDHGPVADNARGILHQLARMWDILVKEKAADQKDEARIGNTIVAIGLRQAAVMALQLKHPAFAEEREWRLVAWPREGKESGAMEFRPSTRGLIPYVALPLRLGSAGLALSDVVVGPTQQPDHGRTAAALFLSNLGYEGEKLVRVSAIPFRG